MYTRRHRPQDAGPHDVDGPPIILAGVNLVARLRRHARKGRHGISVRNSLTVFVSGFSL